MIRGFKDVSPRAPASDPLEKPTGRRDLRKVPPEEERVEIAHLLLE